MVSNLDFKHPAVRIQIWIFLKKLTDLVNSFIYPRYIIRCKTVNYFTTKLKNFLYMTHLRNAGWWIGLDSLVQYSTNFVVPQTLTTSISADPLGKTSELLFRVNGVFGVVTYLRDGQPMNRGSIPGRAYLSFRVQVQSWGLSSFLFGAKKGAFYPRIKRPKRKADRFLLLPRLKNASSYTSAIV